MAGRVKYVPNPMVVPELERSLMMGVALETVAKAAAEKARGIAPVATDAYAQSIEGGKVLEGAWRGRVMSADWKANWIEFGTIHEPAHATLRKGCEALGLRVRGRMRYKWRPSSRGTWY